MSFLNSDLVNAKALAFYAKCRTLHQQTGQVLAAISGNAEIGPRQILTWNNAVFGLAQFASAHGGDTRFRQAVADAHPTIPNFDAVGYYQAIVAAGTPAVVWMRTHILSNGDLVGFTTVDDMLVPKTVNGSVLNGWAVSLAALKTALEADETHTV